MNTHIDGTEISAFLDGALAAGERARAGAHLAACDSCRRELEAMNHLKLVLASAPRKTMPAELALAIERRSIGNSPSFWKAPFRSAFWVPAGAVAAAALVVGLWLRQARAADELPLEPLLAAHARYSAEALVPQEYLVASAYSEQVTALYADAPDAEAE